MWRFAVGVVLAVLAPVQSSAQAEDGHVYRVISYRAHTEQANDYSQAYRTEARPVYDELVRRGSIASYLLLVKDAGSGDSSHMIIIEFADWASAGQFPQNIDAAARAALGRSWSTSQDLFLPMREMVSTDLYVAPPSN
jgi:hypothetical protein